MTLASPAATPPVQSYHSLEDVLGDKEALLKQTLHDSRPRTSRVRITLGIDALPDEELRDIVESSLIHGIYIAKGNAFAKERGLGSEFFVEQRRKHARFGKDRSNDSIILTRVFPEFVDYWPAEGLSREELLHAMKQEFRDQLAAPGTDYHQQEMQNKQTRDVDALVSFGYGRELMNIGRTRVAQECAFDDFNLDEPASPRSHVDLESHDRIENRLLYAMLEDDRNVFGPAITRVATIAVREYGRGGLYWLMEWLFFRGRYTELLRNMGVTEETVGETEFQTMKRDLVRKLPQVHDRMMELLRKDPEIVRTAEIFGWDERTSPAPVAPHADSDEIQQRCRDEREVFLSRKFTEMVLRLHEEGIEAPDFLSLNDEALSLFLTVGGNADRWTAFKKYVIRGAKKQESL